MANADERTPMDRTGDPAETGHYEQAEQPANPEQMTSYPDQSGFTNEQTYTDRAGSERVASDPDAFSGVGDQAGTDDMLEQSRFPDTTGTHVQTDYPGQDSEIDNTQLQSRPAPNMTQQPQGRASTHADVSEDDQLRTLEHGGYGGEREYPDESEAYQANRQG